MSLSTIVVTAENDIAAFAHAVTLKSNALSTAFNALSTTAVADARQLLANAMNDGVTAAAEVAQVAPEVVAATTAAITAASTGNVAGALVVIGGVAQRVEADVVAAFHFFKGIGETTAPAGADAAEQAGVTLNNEGHSLFQAIIDAFTGKTPPAPANPSGAIGG